MNLEEILTTEFLSIPLGTWLVALAVAAGGVVVALVVRWAALAIIRRAAGGNERHAEAGPAGPAVDSATEDAGSGRRLFASSVATRFAFPSLILGGFYAAVAVLDLQGQAHAVASAVFVVLFSLVFIRFLIAVVNEAFRRAGQKHGRVDMSRIRPLRAIAVFAVWIAGGLFLMDNLGLDITAVVAGLGIGGIAIALAAQAVLGDLFSYFVILFDKPFELGDFLIFGEFLGTVEKIGIKTTHLRSLGGEQIVLSNSDLTATRIRNYKRMQTRRVVFRIGVVYKTPPELLKEIPGLLRQVVEAQERVRFDRAHFASYGDWNLSFEIVYHVDDPDYNLYMDIQERINFAIYEIFAERGIQFAFPTSTVHVARDEEELP